MDSINLPFSKKYFLGKEDLEKEKERLLLGLNKKERFEYCLDDACLTGADSIILGITKKEHIIGLEKYL